MEHLAEIARELYDDGLKEGKVECIKSVLYKRVKKFPSYDWKLMLEDAPMEKIDKIKDTLLDISSWEDVEVILNS